MAKLVHINGYKPAKLNYYFCIGERKYVSVSFTNIKGWKGETIETTFPVSMIAKVTRIKTKLEKFIIKLFLNLIKIRK